MSSAVGFGREAWPWIIDSQDLLDEVPVIRSRFVKPIIRQLVGKPSYFRFDSTFVLTV